MFTKLGTEAFSKRLIAMVYGIPKIGKTTLAYKLVKSGAYVYMISSDRGTMDAELDGDTKKAIQNQFLVAYPRATEKTPYLTAIRNCINDLRDRVDALSKKVPSSKIWLCLDTVTHMQHQLMTEARKINIKNPRSDAPKDDFIRDMVTQVDWGINLTLMSEVAEAIKSIPCNIYYIALEKRDSTSTGGITHIPALSGQSSERYKGDADIICRMTLDNNGQRILQCQPAHGIEVGGRSNHRLNPTEAPDLWLIREKILNPTTKEN